MQQDVMFKPSIFYIYTPTVSDLHSYYNKATLFHAKYTEIN